jgi:hypothetical protein
LRLLYPGGPKAGAIRDGAITESGPLAVDVAAFDLTVNGIHKTFTGAVGQPVTDDTINYFWLDDGAGLQVSTTGWPTLPTTTVHLRLGRVVTLGGAITQIVDDRAFLQADSAPAISGSGNPNGLITGLLGETYRDLTTGIWYRCNSDPKGTAWTVV